VFTRREEMKPCCKVLSQLKHDEMLTSCNPVSFLRSLSTAMPPSWPKGFFHSDSFSRVVFPSSDVVIALQPSKPILLRCKLQEAIFLVMLTLTCPSQNSATHERCSRIWLFLKKSAIAIAPTSLMLLFPRLPHTSILA